MASSVESRQNIDTFSPFSNATAVNSSARVSPADAGNQISRGQVKVSGAVETERGEAGVGIQIGTQAAGRKPAGVPHKSNLAMTGGQVLSDDGSGAPQRSMLKRAGADATGHGSLTHQAAGVNSK